MLHRGMAHCNPGSFKVRKDSLSHIWYHAEVHADEAISRRSPLLGLGLECLALATLDVLFRCGTILDRRGDDW